jgi:hypothetical protein
MATYLSIDLDYWSEKPTDRQMFPFVTKALGLGVPTLLVRDHHLLTPHANKFAQCDTLINVDFHDDIVARKVPAKEVKVYLEEGTWVSYVKWRGQATFEWRFPASRCHVRKLGLCDYGCGFMVEHHRDIYGQDSHLTGWDRVTRKHGLAHIPWSDVVAVGISLSPGYLNIGAKPGIYARIFEKLGVPWTTVPKRSFLNDFGFSSAPKVLV